MPFASSAHGVPQKIAVEQSDLCAAQASKDSVVRKQPRSSFSMLICRSIALAVRDLLTSEHVRQEPNLSERVSEAPTILFSDVHHSKNFYFQDEMFAKMSEEKLAWDIVRVMRFLRIHCNKLSQNS
jgi:hypothetical protein